MLPPNSPIARTIRELTSRGYRLTAVDGRYQHFAKPNCSELIFVGKLGAIYSGTSPDNAKRIKPRGM